MSQKPSGEPPLWRSLTRSGGFWPMLFLIPAPTLSKLNSLQKSLCRRENYLSPTSREARRFFTMALGTALWLVAWAGLCGPILVQNVGTNAWSVDSISVAPGASVTFPGPTVDCVGAFSSFGFTNRALVQRPLILGDAVSYGVQEPESPWEWARRGFLLFGTFAMGGYCLKLVRGMRGSGPEGI